MQIQKVTNSSHLPAFKAEIDNEKNHENEFTQVKREFAQLSDSDLAQLAAIKPQRDFNRTARNMLSTMFVAIPAVDIFMSAAAKRGALSSKLHAGGVQAGRWGAIMLTLGAVLGIKHALNSRNENLDNVDKNFPALSFCTDFVAIGAVYAGVLGLAKKSLGYAKTKFAGFFESANKKYFTPLKNALDSSAINKKLIEPADKFLYKKTFGWGKALQAAAFLIAPVMATAALFKGIDTSRQKEQEIRENYELLRFGRELTKVDSDLDEVV